MRIKIQVVKKETRMNRNPIEVSNMRFRRCFPECVWSMMMKPSPPKVNRNALARPSIIYWPLTR